MLTQIAAFWFNLLGEPNHLITTDVEKMGLPPEADRAMLAGRSTLCRKTEVVPIECVVRGYLAGSGWKEYQQSGTVCGIELPPGLTESARLPEPIFTPSTKAAAGHDENISVRADGGDRGPRPGRGVAAAAACGSSAAARSIARQRGIIIADTKFEFGRAGGRAAIDRRSAHARQFALLAGRPIRCPAGGNRRSTSSSCATGSRRPPGTRTARRRRCPTKWWPKPGRNTSKPTNG